MTAQQHIDLLFHVAGTQRIRRRFVPLNERRFQIFDLGFLRGSELTPSQFMTCIFDSFQDLTQLAGSALCGRGRIIELMRKTGGKFTHASVRARPVTVNSFILEKGSTPVTSPVFAGNTTVWPPNSPRN